MRWVLLDEIVSIIRHKKAIARSRVPQSPYSPELLMVEMMAQTGAVLLGAEMDYSEDLIFAKIEEAEFLKELPPGTPLDIEASSDNLHAAGAWIEGKVFSSGVLIGEAKLLLMCVGHFLAGNLEPITFHPAFMDYFQVRSKMID